MGARAGRRRILALAALLAAPLALAACGGGSAAPTTTTTAPGGRSVVIDGRRVAVPTEHGNPITQATGTGDQVIITAAGFEPQVLAAVPNKPITWTNLTDQVQQVNFEYSSVRSGDIAPGKTFSWTPTGLISIRYTSPSGFAGNLLVGVFSQ